MRTKKLVLRFCFSISVFVLSFVLGDCVVQRVLVGEVVTYMERHPIYDHRLIPSSSTVAQRKGEYFTVVRANAIGLREREITGPAPEGTYRILMLGDSFTMGKGVEQEQAFPRMTEQLLNARSDLPHQRYEVVNAGIDSYSPLLEFLILRELFDLIRPDLVIVNFDMSDLTQEPMYWGAARYSSDGELVGVTNSHDPTEDTLGWTPVERWLNRNTYFLAAAYRASFPPGRATRILFMSDPNLLAHTLLPDDKTYERQWNLIFDSFDRTDAFCKQRGIALGISVYPWAHQVSPRECAVAIGEFVPKEYELSDISIEKLEAYARSRELPFLNAFGPFRDYQGPFLYYRRDIHFSPHGHRLMAELLRDFVVGEILAREQP